MMKQDIPKYGALFALQYPQKVDGNGAFFLWIL